MMDRIRSLKQQLNMMQNPQSAMHQMLLNNPQLQSVIQFVKENGNDPKQAFYAAARQMGVNPDDVLRAFQS